MSRESQKIPEWFTIGQPLLWPTLGLAAQIMREKEDPQIRVASECAALHLLHCLNASVELNEDGKHSVAVSLIRQCIEALTIVELGLVDSKVGKPLLKDWRNDDVKQGHIRQRLEADVWSRYGDGLWNESWSEYFGSLSSAVQSYAHYTSALQGWQLVVPEGMKMKETESGMLKSYVSFGPDTYDGNKATRVTLLHILIGWTTGRLIKENGGDERLDDKKIGHLSSALSNSDILGRGELEWAHQFWPLEFDDPNSGGT